MAVTQTASSTALGLLTLAGMTPENWTCSYHPANCEAAEEFVEQILAKSPALVAISALTASIDSAYRFSDKIRQRGVQVPESLRRD